MQSMYNYINRKPVFPRLLKRAAKEIISKPAITKYLFVKPPLPHDFRGEPETANGKRENKVKNQWKIDHMLTIQTLFYL